MRPQNTTHHCLGEENIPTVMPSNKQWDISLLYASYKVTKCKHMVPVNGRDKADQTTSNQRYIVYKVKLY